MSYAVIVDIDNNPIGNLATALGSLFDAVGNPIGLAALRLRVPVFHLGEILVLDGSGREVSGLGRKPGKWSVTIEEFTDIDLAVARAMDVMLGNFGHVDLEADVPEADPPPSPLTRTVEIRDDVYLDCYDDGSVRWR